MIERVYLATNGITLHAAVAGPLDGPLVILLHGFPEGHFAWDGYLGALAEKGFRVVAPDQRGYNLSDKPSQVQAYGFEQLGKDVLGLMDAMARDRAALVGHDWGAAVAWWVAMAAPERVARLVPINVPHPLVMRDHLLRNQKQLLRSWYMFFFQLPWLPEALIGSREGQPMFERLRRAGRPGSLDSKIEAQCRAAWQQPGAIAGMLSWYRAALRNVNLKPPHEGRVAAPTLLIWGQKDPILGQEMALPSLRYCEDGRVHWFPEATHWVLHEEQSAILSLLSQFLAGTPAE